MSKSYDTFDALFGPLVITLMGMGVIFPVDFVVDYIIDTGGRDFISRLEFVTLSYHVGLVSFVIC